MKTETVNKASIDHCANCQSEAISAILNACFECTVYREQLSGSRSAAVHPPVGAIGHHDQPEECMCANCWSYLQARLVARLAELNE